MHTLVQPQAYSACACAAQSLVWAGGQSSAGRAHAGRAAGCWLNFVGLSASAW